MSKTRLARSTRSLSALFIDLNPAGSRRETLPADDPPLITIALDLAPDRLEHRARAQLVGQVGHRPVPRIDRRAHRQPGQLGPDRHQLQPEVGPRPLLAD